MAGSGGEATSTASTLVRLNPSGNNKVAFAVKRNTAKASSELPVELVPMSSITKIAPTADAADVGAVAFRGCNRVRRV